jgi:hypothetical protein
VEVGDLSSWEIEPDWAIADLFSHRGGGQQSREGGSEAVVEQAQHLAILLAGSALNRQIFCRCFSLVRYFLVFDTLPSLRLLKPALSTARDMNKHIFSAALRLNKSVAFLGIEPFHRTGRHF